MRCYSRDEQAKNHMKNFVVAVLKGLKRDLFCESDWFNGKCLGPDMPGKFPSDGTARVCDVALQSVDVEAWGKWCVGTVKPFHGCFQGTLSGGRDQLSSSRLRSK